MASAIETERLTRVFREPRRLFHRAPASGALALDDVTIGVEPGECVALGGPNGAGKSTLLRVMATLVAPSAGSARVLGLDVVGEGARVRPLVGVMTGDDRSFFWRLNAMENLVFFGELQGLARRDATLRAGELLERLGLAADAQRRFGGYSTGMRQRLALARALLHDPPVLLLDEPTANLDLVHRGLVIELLRETIHHRRATALIASHDAGLAVSLADRVVRLDGGRLAGDAPPERVRYRVRARGLTDEQARGLGAEDGVFVVDDLGDGHALAAAVASVVSGGGEIVAVESRQPALPGGL